MLTVNKDDFVSSYPICRPFISFSCPVVLARISSMNLKRNEEREHPCLVAKLSRKALNFSLFKHDITYSVHVCVCVVIIYQFEEVPL